jgi:hypothetical protein
MGEIATTPEGEPVSAPATQSVTRRDAAVAAALAGAVVVVLGYASGLGITVPSTLSVAPPADPATPSAPRVTPQAPAAPMTMPATAPAVAMPGTQAGTTHEHPTGPGPTTPPVSDPPAPGPDPEPPDPHGGGCGKGLVEALPVVGAAAAPVTSLIGSVLGSTPVVDDVAAPPAPGRTPGPLSCVVGAVLGPSCCDTASTARPKDEG